MLTIEYIGSIDSYEWLEDDTLRLELFYHISSISFKEIEAE